MIIPRVSLIGLNVFKAFCSKSNLVIIHITINNDDNGTSQFDDVNSGWTYSFTTTDCEHFFICISPKSVVRPDQKSPLSLLLSY